MRSSTATKLLLGALVVFLVIGTPIAITGSSEERRTVLGVVFAAGVIALLFWAKRTIVTDPRRRAFEAEARRLGLESSSSDPSRIASLPFDVLARPATIRDVDNVLRGTWKGAEVVVFEYRTANDENESRYTCAMFSVPAGWPSLLVKPETPLTRAARDVGLRDVELELERFNRSFEVRASDRRFSTAVLEPQMMEWLMGLSPPYGFEIRDGWLLASTAQVQPWEIDRVLRTAREFLERIPSVAHSLFDTAAPPRPEGPP